ncbi:hypothetical protein [Pedobacter aquatilis]|uniref:hypothetical protein n=1 Tax=Pedobacter aquatilis TaxID=351343 RepID=UPI00292DEDC5|nr:hypothetical protein [Pedobacter aquatilis]
MDARENPAENLLSLALKARFLADAFDRFWRNEIEKRHLAHHAYFIRHVSLLNAFDNFLYLFCSRELWSAGGTGAWAANCNVSGPLKPLSNGDQINKIITLITDQQAEVSNILAIYQSPAEQEHIAHELAHISKTLALLGSSMEEIQI